jgi:6-phosphogluconolactonase
MLKVLASLILWGFAATSAAAAAAPCSGPLVYFGSFAEGPGPGIVGARLDERSGRLCPLGRVAEIEQPTWMTMHPAMPVLYATRQVAGVDGPGAAAYRVDLDTGALHPINAVSSGGAEPTYLSVDAGSRTLFAAHWGSGHVSALPIREDGGLGAPVSVQGEQASAGGRPRTHQIEREPSGRFVIAAEFGLDRMLIYRFDPRARTLTPAEPARVQLPPASGPRHFVFHPERRRLYLLNERTSEIHLYRWDADAVSLRLEQQISTLGPGYTGKKHAAGIAITPDGRFLYVSNRGEDVIVAYAVDAATGRVSEVQRIASGGRDPRDFALSPSGRWVLVANQTSGAINVFARNPATGRLTNTGQAMAAVQPVVVTFAEAGTGQSDAR